MNFLDRFSRKAQLSSFIKIHQLGADLFHADWQTHRDREMDGLTEKTELKKKYPYLPSTRLVHMLIYVGDGTDNVYFQQDGHMTIHKKNAPIFQ